MPVMARGYSKVLINEFTLPSKGRALDGDLSRLGTHVLPIYATANGRQVQARCRVCWSEDRGHLQASARHR
jgi:hypothetical protein